MSKEVWNSQGSPALVQCHRMKPQSASAMLPVETIGIVLLGLGLGRKFFLRGKRKTC